MKTPFLTSLAIPALCCSALASGTVTNLTQTALQKALVGGGTVLFGTTGTLTLTSTITIGLNTTLDANGHAVIISGGNAVRLFQVNSNVTFAIKDLTLADGRVVGANGADGDPPAPGQGAGSAAILNLYGHIILNRCTLTNNSVQGGNAGQMTNLSGTISAKGGYGRGGAISSLGGTLNLTNCIFAANSASGGAGSGQMGSPNPVFGRSGDALGGAIYCEGGSLSADSITFFTNSATGGVPGQGGSGGAGRAGDAFGGALYITNATLLMSSSTCQNNFVHGGEPIGYVVGGDGSGDGLGGALFLSLNSTGQIRLCRFEGDSAAGGNVGGRNYNAGAGEGGHVYSTGSLHIWNSSFARGQSFGGGNSWYPAFSKGGAYRCSDRDSTDRSNSPGRYKRNLHRRSIGHPAAVLSMEKRRASD